MKIKKVFKTTGKIFLISFLSLLFVVITLVVVALYSENTITRLALKEVSKMIDAPVEVDNVSLLLFRNFPYATVEFNNFKLGAFHGHKADSLGLHSSDTILTLKKLFVSIKTKPLLKSQIIIEKVEIEGFAFNYFVDSTGISNLDFLLETDEVIEPEVTDTTSMALDVLLRNLTLRDISVNFNDESLKTKAFIHIPEMNITGKVRDSYYAGSVKGSVLLTNVDFEDTNLSLMHQSALNFNITYDDGAIDIKSIMLSSDGVLLNGNGIANLGDSTYVDMKFNLSEFNLKELSKYAPAEMLSEFGLVGIDGKVNLQAHVKGYVFDTIVLPRVDATISLKDGSVITTEYPAIKHMSFNGSVAVPDPNNMQTMSANFKAVRVATPQSAFNLAFDVRNFDKPIYDVKANAIVNLDEFNSFLPDSTVEYISGRINMNFATKGQLPNDIGMNSADYFLNRTSLAVSIRDFSTALDSIDEIKNLSVDFSYKPNRQVDIKNFALEAPSYGISIDSSSLHAKILGLVSDMDNMGLDIDSYFFRIGNNTLKGKASVLGLVKPTFNLDTELKVDLDEISKFIPDSLVDHISGKIDFHLTSYGTVDLDSIDNYVLPIAFEQSKMKVKVRDFNFLMFDDTLAKVDNLSVDFAMANDTMHVDNLYANLHGIDFWLDSTTVTNVYKAFLLEQKDQTIVVNTHVKLSDINYAMFEPLMATDSTQTEEADLVAKTDTIAEEPMYIPPYIVRGTFAVNSVKYEDIFLQNLSSNFRIDEFLYVLDDFKLDAFGGSMKSSLLYDTRQDSLQIVQFKNEIFGMDIRQLLIDAKDFEQDEFTHKNISGKLTSSFNGRVVMQDTTIFYDKINVIGHFKLEDGGIYEFEPLMELSKFTNLRELDNVIFRTMESSVFIYNNNIYFPKTDIVSSAIDMSVYGLQSFNTDYEYHFIVFLSDVLLGKSSKLLKQQGMDKEGFEGEDQSNRRGLYLIAKDREGETKYGFDNKRLQRMMTTTIRLQNRGLSLMFNPRLVNFSTEVDRREYKKKEDEPEAEPTAPNADVE